jgi:flavin-dependent dehydrogenase
MNSESKVYDIIIVGGGLAGLSTAILSAKNGRSVLLIEKENYPRMKVCGEYISNESRKFLKELGLPIEELHFPEINQFVLTTPLGDYAKCNLLPGGMGISRYFLDDFLAQKAQELGVTVLTNTKVKHLTYLKPSKQFLVNTTDSIQYYAKLAILAAGRNSGLLNKSKSNGDKFVGVKYHVSEGPADNTIEIHHFEGGYCGISKVEGNKFCLCYLVKADALKAYQGNINAFEEYVMSKNTFLKVRLQSPRISEAVTTSNIQFGIFNQTNNNNLTIGDSAGFIPPITGNGMSLAFRSAKHIHIQIEHFFNGTINFNDLSINSNQYKNQYLKSRIQQGIFLQNLLFLKNRFLKFIVFKSITKIPGLIKILSKQAVGKEI